MRGAAAHNVGKSKTKSTPDEIVQEHSDAIVMIAGSIARMNQNEMPTVKKRAIRP